MTAEIEHSFGAPAVACLLSLPYENYILAYDYAMQDGNNLSKSTKFSAETKKIANDRQKARSDKRSFPTCISDR